MELVVSQKFNQAIYAQKERAFLKQDLVPVSEYTSKKVTEDYDSLLSSRMARRNSAITPEKNKKLHQVFSDKVLFGLKIRSPSVI